MWFNIKKSQEAAKLPGVYGVKYFKLIEYISQQITNENNYIRF